MLLGVMSDTHDKLETTTRALNFLVSKNVSTIVHCGDWKSPSTLRLVTDFTQQHKLPLFGVLGNNDHAADAFLALAETLPGEIRLQAGVLECQLGDKRISVYHGHHKPTLTKLQQAATWDILLLGHTHKPIITSTNQQLIVNPGSTAFAIPRSREWRPSVALVDTESMHATIEYIP